MDVGCVAVQVLLLRTRLVASRNAALKRPLFLVNCSNMPIQVLLRSTFMQTPFLFASVQPLCVHNSYVLLEVTRPLECFGAI